MASRRPLMAEIAGSNPARSFMSHQENKVGKALDYKYVLATRRNNTYTFLTTTLTWSYDICSALSISATQFHTYKRTYSGSVIIKVDFVVSREDHEALEKLKND